MQSKHVYITVPTGNLNFREIFFNVFTILFSDLKVYAGICIVNMDKLQSYLKTLICTEVFFFLNFPS